MAELMIDQAMQAAMRHHQSGQLPEAERVYRQVLAQQPDHAGALHLLGVLSGQKGQLDAAIELIQRALRVGPDDAEAYYNLGIMMSAAGRADEAIEGFRQSLEAKSGNERALYNLAVLLQGKGLYADAGESYREVLRIRPDHAEAHNNLGNVLSALGRLDEAIASFRKALLIQPNLVQARINLGNALKDQGKINEAMDSYRQARQIQPDLAEAHYLLGNLLIKKGQLGEAAAALLQAIQVKPDCAEALNDLGHILHAQQRFDEAHSCFERAIKHKPDMAVAHNNLANSFRDGGQIEQAIICHRRALEHKPHNASFHSNLMVTLLCYEGSGNRSLFDESRCWSQLHAEPLAKFIRPHGHDRNLEQRLRIGYVSSDFRDHPVARFLLPLLEKADRSQFEVFCYADVSKVDTMTERLRGLADQWRDIGAWPDEKAAEQIRHDHIDILVDLGMHTKGNRLLVFAHKPAPVQVTYLAYPGTTGLTTIDYRLSDPYLDPEEMDATCYSEQTVRLPQTFWCYQNDLETMVSGELPVLRADHITFGSLNNFCKVSTKALETWAKLLLLVPDSRLIFHAHPGGHRERVAWLFGEMGVDPARCEFVGFLPTGEYFDQYRKIDICLDSFPFAGGTTTCDALWMGVPVVTLAGRTAVGRGGVSILSNVGLPELIAKTHEEYIVTVADLAKDIPRLQKLRFTLRERMQGSPLMNAKHFTNNMEAAYRRMWKAWCTGTEQVSGR